MAYLNRAWAYQQAGETQKAKADRAKGEKLQGGPRPGGR
jgi:hypothetical protein